MKTLATFSTAGARTLVFACTILLVAATNSTRAQEALLREQSAHNEVQRTGIGQTADNPFSLPNQNQAIGSLQELKSGPTFLFNVTGGDANIHGLTVGRGGGAHITNTALGFNALLSNVAVSPSSGLGNTSIGINTMWANESGSYNTAIGHYTAYLMQSGEDNTAIGADAFTSFGSGSFNVGVGSYAFQFMTQGNGNTAVGPRAGTIYPPSMILKSSAPLTNSTFIGHESGPSFSDLTNSTGIGYQARPFFDNQVVIGNEEVTEIGGYSSWINFFDPILVKSSPEEDVAGLDFILRLRPVTYQLDADMMITRKMERASIGRDGQKIHNQVTDREIELLKKNAAITQSGFMPEEVLEAARETGYDFNGISVSEREPDRYGIRYGSFIMPIVKSIQELNDKVEAVLPENMEQMTLALELQQAEIEKLQARNAQLEQQVADIYDMLQRLSADLPGHAPDNALNGRLPVSQFPSDVSAPRLEQNAPNPFHEQSTIRYYLPEGAGEARITITDIQGNRVRTVALRDSGHGAISISGGSLATGTYLYSLVVNGRVIDSKRMVIL